MTINIVVAMMNAEVENKSVAMRRLSLVDCHEASHVSVKRNGM